MGSCGLWQEAHRLRGRARAWDHSPSTCQARGPTCLPSGASLDTLPLPEPCPMPKAGPGASTKLPSQLPLHPWGPAWSPDGHFQWTRAQNPVPDMMPSTRGWHQALGKGASAGAKPNQQDTQKSHLLRQPSPMHWAHTCPLPTPAHPLTRLPPFRDPGTLTVSRKPSLTTRSTLRTEGRHTPPWRGLASCPLSLAEGTGAEARGPAQCVTLDKAWTLSVSPLAQLKTGLHKLPEL